MKPVPRACLPYIYASPCTARVYTEALVTEYEDVRNRASEVASATLTNVEGYDDGSLRLTGSGVAVISKATGTDFYSTLTNLVSANYDVVGWNLADTIGSPAVLRAVSVRLTRRRVAGNPAFDGWFLLHVHRLRTGLNAGSDEWELQPVADSVPQLASAMASDEENVAFAFATTGTKDRAPPAINLDAVFDAEITPRGAKPRPAALFPGRTVVISVEAKGGTNTNYAVIRDNSVTTVTATGGTLMVKAIAGKTASQQGARFRPKAVGTASVGTGLWRCSFTTASYPASGTASYTDVQKINFGAVPTGDIEVVARISVPPGTSLLTYVSASLTAVASWTAVTDGQVLSALTTAIATASMYAIKADFAAATTLDVTPVLWEFGLRSRTVTDLTEYCTVGPGSESVNPISGEVLLGECEVSVLRHGDRDFNGIERLLSETDFDDIEVRTYIGHEDLARGDWLYLDTWRVDDYEVRQADVRLTAVSVLERLKGRYPVAVVGPVAYIMSNTTSTLIGGSFNKLFATSSGTAATVTLTLLAAATSTMGFCFTEPGVPGLARWPFGTWTVEVNVTGTASNAAVRVIVSRVTGLVTGTATVTSYTSEEQSAQATGVKTFTLANVTWAAGTSTDRLRVAVVVTNVSATSTVSITLQIGTLNSETIAPWTPVVERSPISVAAATPQAAWNQWITAIGLAERYQGDPPPNVTDLIGKEILDADGKRELERIAFVAGGMPIASQGRVTFAPLLLPNGVVAAVFPWESYTPISVSPGFRSRIPVMYVPYGYDGGKFRGEVKVVHAAALDTYGVSRIDTPDQRVEDETAKYFRDMTLASIVGQDLVLAGGAGMMTATIRPSFRHPELELGDTVALETDLFALQDPLSGDPIRGYVWAIGRIIGRAGPWNDELTVWIRGVSDLHNISATAEKRTPYDAPIAVITVEPDADNPARARVRIGTQISGASIYYVVLADGSAYPTDTEHPDWTAYSTVVTVARNATADRLVAAFATANGILGPVFQARIAPSAVAAGGFIGTLAGTESGATITIVASDPSPTVRKIRWYMRQDATLFPTANGSANGVLNETYYVAFNEIAAELGGSLAQAHTGVVYTAVASAINVIAVPVDFNGEVGARKTLTYHWLGVTTPTITSPTWVAGTTTVGVPRTVDFAWVAGAGLLDATHDLAIYAEDGVARTTLATVTNPSTGTNAAAGTATGFTTGSGAPQVNVIYLWEVLAGAAVVNSGVFSPGYGDTFDRGDGLAY